MTFEDVGHQDNFLRNPRRHPPHQIARHPIVNPTRVLGELLDHGPHFSHRFSRNPFYTGKAPTAYRWYRQHNRVMRLGGLVKQPAFGVAALFTALAAYFLGGRVDIVPAGAHTLR